MINNNSYYFKELKDKGVIKHFIIYNILFFTITLVPSFLDQIRYNESNIKTNDLPALTKNKITIINYIPYSHDSVEAFSDKIKKSIDEFNYEATIREREIVKYNKFFYDLKPRFFYEKAEGYCYKDYIGLNMNYSKSTFFHEMGHCLYNLGHVNDKKVANIGMSDKIMNWYFHDDLINDKEVLDVFFRKDHPKIKDKDLHEIMVSEINIYESLSSEEKFARIIREYSKEDKVEYVHEK